MENWIKVHIFPESFICVGGVLRALNRRRWIGNDPWFPEISRDRNMPARSPMQLALLSCTHCWLRPLLVTGILATKLTDTVRFFLKF